MTNRKNLWHRRMYDSLYAAQTIASRKWHGRSAHEAGFVLRTLAAPAGARWLDVPCGTGRHAILFAREGYRVTGLDISRDCLELARKHNSHPNIDYRFGNMARLARFRGRFDVLTNLFTSFGYFANDEQNRQVLQGMVRCLKSGGSLALNTINRDYLMTVYSAARWRNDGHIEIIEASRYDPRTRYNESQTVFIDKKTGRGNNYYSRVRLYDRSEVVALMKECGLRKIRVYGDFDGGKFDRLRSTHPIYVGTLP